jgi:hypothetical protein
MIAYASLAGLPPQAGLYTLLASLALYAIFGTSRHLVVAGTSASAVLVFSAASDTACPRGSAPHAPGVPQYSRFPRQAAPAARINHDDVTLPWSGPRRCHIVVVARDSAL